MIKHIILLFICVWFSTSVPVYSQTYQTNTSVSYPVISNIENNMFGTTYQYNNIYQRVNRLENALFGTMFPQEDLYNRIKRINNAAASNYYNNNNGFNSTSFSNGYYGNSLLGNQNNNVNSNGNLIQKILGFAIPVLSGLANSSYNNSYYNYEPGLLEEINRYQNANYGVGVKILP